MTFLNNRILMFFSLGLNAGFLIFLVFHLTTLPDTRKERALKISLSALQEISVSQDQEKNIIAEITAFHNKIKKLHKDILGERLALLALYSHHPRDINKIKEIEAILENSSAQKNMLFFGHIKTMDQLLGDAAPDYFAGVHKRVKAHFEAKR